MHCFLGVETKNRVNRAGGNLFRGRKGGAGQQITVALMLHNVITVPYVSLYNMTDVCTASWGWKPRNRVNSAGGNLLKGRQGGAGQQIASRSSCCTMSSLYLMYLLYNMTDVSTASWGWKPRNRVNSAEGNLLKDRQGRGRTTNRSRSHVAQCRHCILCISLVHVCTASEGWKPRNRVCSVRGNLFRGRQGGAGPINTILKFLSF